MIHEEKLFREVAQLAPGERMHYLDQVCDPHQRARMEALLLGYDESQRALPAPLVAQGTLMENEAGERFGPYRLVEKLGEGGCGYYMDGGARRAGASADRPEGDQTRYGHP